MKDYILFGTKISSITPFMIMADNEMGPSYYFYASKGVPYT